MGPTPATMKNRAPGVRAALGLAHNNYVNASFVTDRGHTLRPSGLAPGPKNTDAAARAQMPLGADSP